MTHGPAVWSSPHWREEAVAWVDAQDIERTGPEHQRIRPWATVLRIPTTAGDVWMKACAPATAYEVGLYDLLAGVTRDWVLEPLASDAARGWLLLPDGGPVLGEGDRERFAGALADYGSLQRALTPYVEDLVALGAPDMRPAVMPARFDEALEGVELDAAVRRRISALRSEYAEACERLGASGVPASLDHNDLHPANVLDGGDGRVRFYDWGDAVVSHPFASMLVPLGMVDGDPSVRDRYLAGFGDPAALRETLALACRVARVARALTWERAVRAARDAGEPVAPVWASAAADWLASLLEPASLPAAE